MSREVHVRFCEGLGVRFPRATRLVIFVRSARSAERVFASVQRYLNETLKLVINQQKSYAGLPRTASIWASNLWDVA